MALGYNANQLGIDRACAISNLRRRSAPDRTGGLLSGLLAFGIALYTSASPWAPVPAEATQAPVVAQPELALSSFNLPQCCGQHGA